MLLRLLFQVFIRAESLLGSRNDHISTEIYDEIDTLLILQVKTFHGVYDLNTENTVIMVYVDIVLNYTMAVNYSIRSHCNMVQRGQFLHISCFDVNEKGCHINYDK